MFVLFFLIDLKGLQLYGGWTVTDRDRTNLSRLLSKHKHDVLLRKREEKKNEATVLLFVSEFTQPDYPTRSLYTNDTFFHFVKQDCGPKHTIGYFHLANDETYNLSTPVISQLSIRATSDHFVKTFRWLVFEELNISGKHVWNYWWRPWQLLHTVWWWGTGKKKKNHAKPFFINISDKPSSCKIAAPSGPTRREVKVSADKTRSLASEMRNQTAACTEELFLPTARKTSTQPRSESTRRERFKTLQVAFEQFPRGEEHDVRTVHSAAMGRLLWKMEPRRFGWQSSRNDECLRDTWTMAWN